VNISKKELVVNDTAASLFFLKLKAYRVIYLYAG